MLNTIQYQWRTKRRQILIAWLAAWPTLTVVLFVLGPFSYDWPLPLRSLASATAMVLIMNFFSVPTAGRLVEKIFPKPSIS